MIRRFFQQDNMLFGFILGIVIPAAFWGILLLIVLFLIPAVSGKEIAIVKTSTLQLVAIFINLITMRYYLLRLKFDFTGRGILLSTIILAIIYFIIHL